MEPCHDFDVDCNKEEPKSLEERVKLAACDSWAGCKRRLFWELYMWVSRLVAAALKDGPTII